MFFCIVDFSALYKKLLSILIACTSRLVSILKEEYPTPKSSIEIENPYLCSFFMLSANFS